MPPKLTQPAMESAMLDISLRDRTHRKMKVADIISYSPKNQ